MKKAEYRTGNRVRIDTGYALFDKNCEVLMTGNVCGNCQNSSYIRPFSETECNGFTYPPGHLRDFDLQSFKSIPAFVLERVLEATKTEQAILYEFRVFKKTASAPGDWAVPICYILTRGHDRNHELIFAQPIVVGRSNAEKIARATEVIKDYVSNPTPADKSRMDFESLVKFSLMATPPVGETEFCGEQME
jgi:hypothetical protein